MLQKNNMNTNAKSGNITNVPLPPFPELELWHEYILWLGIGRYFPWFTLSWESQEVVYGIHFLKFVEFRNERNKCTKYQPIMHIIIQQYDINPKIWLR